MRFTLVPCLAALPLLALASCKPPAADDYVARVGLEDRSGPSAPLQSPDTKDAQWVASREPGRIIYGNPGEPPLLALACVEGAEGAQIAYERIVDADPEAKAILALIGNSHVTRLFVDAEKTGADWRWRGATDAADPALEALTGPRQVEATVPGAGSVVLNPSSLPRELINRCRAQMRDREAAPAPPEALLNEPAEPAPPADPV
ncbi:hypothetical protein A9995_03670 [Erythrobacter sp. QSSC1-22B]|uniref:hypothetical protein n=1 Tax=Erythrobacter sp. QSSC1-22B TaxID=1860125 RepID=UPI000805C0C4|nr:hypothetical protein [Erythrobacter sp. QSSC1-22B]OBX20792.1 hypothetical protein A9995_03670 [Erythrobacter sp. QSSC1-22B]